MLLWTLERSTCLILSDYEGNRNEKTRLFSMKHFQEGERKAAAAAKSGWSTVAQVDTNLQNSSPIITPLIKLMKRKIPNAHGCH